jgi:putative ABC transport system permease protein
VGPALRVSRGGDLSGLRERSGAPLGGRKQRLRSALVMAEVTACVVLLVSSGLLIRALWRVQATDPGFRAEGVLTIQTPLPPTRYAATARRAEVYSRILSEVRALPGVTAAGYISRLPLVERGGIWPVQVEGQPADGEALQRSTSVRFVTPGLFDALGIARLRGRDVAESDTAQAQFVAVVSESFVRRHFPGQDPLGRRFTIAFDQRTIAGVVADIHVRGLERESEPQVYLPYRQVKDGWLIGYIPKELVVRSSTGAPGLAAAVREVLRRADPELPMAAVRTMSQVVENDTAPRRTQLQVLGAFAGLALLLAGVGLHGLLSFAVSQRLPEMGVRVALGARSADILRMVLREGLVLAGVGALAGLVLANIAGRAMRALLFGVAPGDPGAFLAAAAVTLLMTLSGSLFPALRAVRVDPSRALRAE